MLQTHISKVMTQLHLRLITAKSAVVVPELNNRTQIFAGKMRLSAPDTDEGLDKAGRAREVAYQTLKIAKEQKLDIEKALFDNNAKVAGNASTARELAGAPAWMTTGVDFQSGNSGANPTGDVLMHVQTMVRQQLSHKPSLTQ